jgi:hypothetical protein
MNMILFVIIAFLILLLFILYYKYTRLKQHCYLQEIASIYLLYITFKPYTKDTSELLYTIFNYVKIPLRDNYIKIVKMNIEYLTTCVQNVELILNLNNKMDNIKK